jgi:hypothetical protein
MKEWIPLLRELVWPIFWACVALCAWRPIVRLLKASEERIAAGAEFEAGAKGIRIGAAPKLAEIESVTTKLTVDQPETPPTAPTPGRVYLVHTARRDRRFDVEDRQYYRVRVYLDADEPQLLDDVSEVTYRFHETVRHPVRTIRDRQTSFETRTELWGEFNLAAIVRFKDGRDMKLEPQSVITQGTVRRTTRCPEFALLGPADERQRSAESGKRR